MAKIAVLGAGMVGSAIARVMSKHHKVVLFDGNPLQLKKCKGQNITTQVIDFKDLLELKKRIEHVDLVMGAVPGHLGYKVLEQVILSKKNMVDISFFPEDGLKLHSLAKKNQVTAIYDCGVAPGMDNILLGYHDQSMKVTDFKCYVGGLPKVKNPPFNYKAPFSPIDVLEEYTRPARFKKDGIVVTKPALTDIEHLRLPVVGTLEAFNSDGLRSLIKTMAHIPNMIEKTLRFPGHAVQMEYLKAIGLLNKKSIEVKSQTLAPIDLTAHLLFKHWKYLPGEADFTVMQVILEGIEKSQKIRYTYDLYDEYDPVEDMSAMARTTGLTACAAAEMVLQNTFREKGVFVPEYIGKAPGRFGFIIDYLKNSGVNYKRRRTKI
ncbi:MAG: saccharopine dehydrogenase NADP-binding domain-containing protein [Saprospiraceae bacterium]|nr:saccharopine dehydrogenase NADP-binding domain-containing protein [Saprospiraceae bacterium]